MEVMLLPLLTCLILTGMHAYLGLHVIDRGVIFVDLALAQIAALGAVGAFLLGYELHSVGAYLCSLLCALGGALAFALLRPKHPGLSVEAVIGIAYAVAASLSILLLSVSAEGAEELRSLLVGHLLFVGWPELLKVVFLYCGIAILHYRFRKEFLRISREPEDAAQGGLTLWKWDFLFYASFAMVITSSVELAGVLLVFSFLVVPAVCGLLMAHTVMGRLLVGWGIGIVGSVLGLWVSYLWDLPTGATVVCVLGILFLFVFLLFNRERAL